jgi:hypothetical protein
LGGLGPGGTKLKITCVGKYDIVLRTQTQDIGCDNFGEQKNL